MAQFDKGINTNPKFRVGRVIVLIMTFLLMVMIFEYYQAQAKQDQFNEDIQGLSEYELCMVAYEKFGMKAVKEVGCVDGKYKSLGLVE